MRRGADRAPRRLAVATLVLWTATCHKGPAPPAERQSSPGTDLSAAPRSIRVEEARIVLEGRWQPVAPTAAPPPRHAVRVVCLQSSRRCTEELDVVPAGGGEVERQTADYPIKDWTKWQLRALRRGDQGRDVELRISIVGLAAEKVEIDRSSSRGAETRWRLE